eukprot:scaffold664710_cov34-Prasinocladus_malaysianus.AAC.1
MAVIAPACMACPSNISRLRNAQNSRSACGAEGRQDVRDKNWLHRACDSHFFAVASPWRVRNKAWSLVQRLALGPPLFRQGGTDGQQTRPADQ